jgi:hypothetical protein
VADAHKPMRMGMRGNRAYSLFDVLPVFLHALPTTIESLSPHVIECGAPSLDSADRRIDSPGPNCSAWDSSKAVPHPTLLRLASD